MGYLKNPGFTPKIADHAVDWQEEFTCNNGDFLRNRQKLKRMGLYGATRSLGMRTKQRNISSSDVARTSAAKKAKRLK